MTVSVDRDLYHELRKEAHQVTGDRHDFDPLLALVGDSRFVLIGEASHGTHEFYRIRAEITKRLIREKGFSAIAVEADWPDAYRVNRYVQGRGGDADATQALGGFKRFPQWMWRNADVLEFTGWLRDYNDAMRTPRKVGFYGLDLYSMHASMEAVLSYLRVVDPEAALRAQRRYACFEHFGESPQTYGYATTAGLAPSCENEVVAQLVELQKSAAAYATRDGRQAADDLFFAEQNARIVLNAERYYRAMFGNHATSWNLRDRHMADTLDRLMRHYGPDAKAIVWEHNTHIGDARHTDMADDGMVNVGQLVREQHAAQGVVLVGFGSHRGGVIAGQEWEAEMERMPVPPAREGSWEDVLHRAAPADSLLILDEARGNRELHEERGHRAIGVVYRPEYEAYGNYVPTVLPRRYDAFLYFDRTRALRPLHLRVEEGEEVPETYPTGM
jgi:erythromycin esterase